MAAKTISMTTAAGWLLRLGLAFVFAYAAGSMLLHPLDWTGYMPGLLTKFAAATTLVKLFAVYEIALALWLLSGKFVRYAALLCAATLLGIVAANTGQLIVTFRDLGLACMAGALAFLSD